MANDQFDVIGQDIYFDKWLVATIHSGIPTTVHDRFVGDLHDIDREAHEKELDELREQHEADLAAGDEEPGELEAKVRAQAAELETLRGLLHLMGADDVST